MHIGAGVHLLLGAPILGRRRYADITMGYSLDSNALRAARHAKGLTQPQLSAAVGVAGAPRISAWELGQETPHPHQLRNLASILGVPIATLLQSVEDDQRDLRRLRIEAGLTISELACQIHVANPTLKRWERGVVRGLVSRAPIDGLADALGVNERSVVAALERTRPV